MIDRENMLITLENLSNDLRVIEDGFTVRDSNLSQMKARTKILEGVKGLTFEGCNLKNCELPEDAIVKDCLVCHEDVVVKTQEEIDLDAKKALIEQQTIDSFRVDVQAEIEKADVTRATAETIKAAVIASAKTVGKP
jgi:hypothetical protein